MPSKVNIDPTFEKRIRDLRSAAEGVADSGKVGQGSPWFRPGDWDGNLHDPEGLVEPFEADRASAEAVQAMDPEDPGTTMDLVAAQTQMEYLAELEQAMRQWLMMPWPRAAAHAIGRQKTMSSDRGPFGANSLEYVRQLLAKGRG